MSHQPRTRTRPAGAGRRGYRNVDAESFGPSRSRGRREARWCGVPAAAGGRSASTGLRRRSAAPVLEPMGRRAQSLTRAGQAPLGHDGEWAELVVCCRSTESTRRQTHRGAPVLSPAGPNSSAGNVRFRRSPKKRHQSSPGITTAILAARKARLLFRRHGVKQSCVAARPGASALIRRPPAALCRRLLGQRAGCFSIDFSAPTWSVASRKPSLGIVLHRP